jgi:hypothetical protein
VLVEPSDPEQEKQRKYRFFCSNRRGGHTTVNKIKTKTIMKNITTEHQRDKREPTKTLNSEKLLFRELVLNYTGQNSKTKLYLSFRYHYIVFSFSSFPGHK